MSNTIHQGRAEEKGVEARPLFSSIYLKQSLKQVVSLEGLKKDSCFVNDGSNVLLLVAAGNPQDALAGEHDGT